MKAIKKLYLVQKFWGFRWKTNTLNFEGKFAVFFKIAVVFVFLGVSFLSKVLNFLYYM